jgi:subtilisin family serine protease
VKSLLALLRGLLLAALFAVPAVGYATDGEASPPDDNRAAHQVLVMLHLPAPHYRPDSGYSGSYGDDGSHSARHRIAEELARAHGLILVTDWPMPALGIDCYVMEDPAHGTAAHMIEVLSADKRIEWVQPMSTFHTLGNDPLFPAQPSSSLWHLNDLHRIATGRNVTVAVIDSGVEDDHPDLRGQVVLKENFVDGMPYAGEQHGTAVAGIIAAVAGNGIGIEGIAPNARVMALRACWQPPDTRAQCNSFTLGKALNFAIAHDARIINLSLGGPPDRLLGRLIDVAIKRGIMVVAAVDPQSADGGFPASFGGVLAVASLDARGRLAHVILAPGRDIPTTAIDGRWNFVSGTSYAAAHVTGMMALLDELNPAMSAAQIEAQVVSAGPDSSDGVDACATIGRITGNCPCSCTAAHVSKTPLIP